MILTGGERKIQGEILNNIPAMCRIGKERIKMEGKDDESASFVKRVSEQGRVTIPKEYRDFLDISEGDLVQVRVVKKKKEEG